MEEAGLFERLGWVEALELQGNPALEWDGRGLQQEGPPAAVVCLRLRHRGSSAARARAAVTPKPSGRAGNPAGSSFEDCASLGSPFAFELRLPTSKLVSEASTCVEDPVPAMSGREQAEVIGAKARAGAVGHRQRQKGQVLSARVSYPEL